jgi:hypothetical protein
LEYGWQIGLVGFGCGDFKNRHKKIAIENCGTRSEKQNGSIFKTLSRKTPS